MERTEFIIEFIDQEALDQFQSLPKATQKTLGKAIKERLAVDPVIPKMTQNLAAKF